MKKTLLIPAAIAISYSGLSSSHAEMTDVQREDLVKRLDKLLNQSKEKLTSRQATAYVAYKKGLSSNTAAMELYLKCVEKVDFIEQGKKSSDFRDWKRKEKEKLSDPGFRLALRHQLNWLVLSIDAARSEEEDYSALSSRARDAVDKIFDDAQRLGSHHGLLNQSVLGSIYSRAYGFGTYKIKEWPLAPLNVADVYEKVVFPPLREFKKASTLRSAWQQRISYQEEAIEQWSPVPKSKTIGMKKNLKPPAYYKFIEQQRPKLIWEMEKDVYKAGDEYGAASRMISHLTKHINHIDATEWAEQLEELIKPEEDLAETSTSDNTTPTVSDTGGYIELPVE